ncbi:MAG: glycerophosphodiester phosphodiesterase family protein [Anaerolineales bacterium]
MEPEPGLGYLYRHTPLILGHRGASAYAPENTLSAFKLALAQGADGVELDVTLSADGVAVVIHDDSLDRTTSGHGPVGAQSLAALKQLTAGYPARFGQQFRDEKLPTLAEVFAGLPPEAIVNVELKRDHSTERELAAKVVALIHEGGMERRVLISSFQYSSLRRVKALDSKLPVGLLYSSSLGGPRLARCVAGTLPHEAHHPSYERLTAASVAWYHAHGWRVNAWTVDDAADLRRLAAAGVDGLITNRPDTARKAIGQAAAAAAPAASRPAGPAR